MTRVIERLFDDFVNLARNTDRLKMRSSVHPAQVAFRLVVAHHTVEADNFIKSGARSSICARQILIVDDDFKDRTHCVALLVDKRAVLGRTEDCWERSEERRVGKECGS